MLAELDYLLFSSLNGLAGRWPWLDGLARWWLNDYFVPTLLALLLLALWFEGERPPERLQAHRAVLTGALSAGVANLIVKTMNLLYERPRPFAEHEVVLLFYRPTDSSLPSNAAALGFSIAVGVWFYRRGWGWLMLGIAALFGLSRIFGGVHYPLDVLAGAAVGAGSAWLVRWQQRRVEILLEGIRRLARRLDLV